jgi:hypothetical protein
MDISNVVLLSIVICVLYMCFRNDDIENFKYGFEDKFGFNQTKSFYIKNKADDKCLGQYVGSLNNLAVMRNCKVQKNHMWKLTATGRLLNLESGECLNRDPEYENASSKPCSENSGQKWLIDDDQRLVSLLDNNNSCLDRFVNNNDDMTIIKPCGSQLSQKWYAVPVDNILPIPEITPEQRREEERKYRIMVAEKREEERKEEERIIALKLIALKIIADKAAADKAAADKAIADKLAADKLAADKLAADKLAADKLAVDKAAADKLAADKLAADKLAADKLAADKLAVDKAAADKLAADKLAADKAKELSGGAIAGISIAVIGVVVLCCVGLYFAFRPSKESHDA